MNGPVVNYSHDLWRDVEDNTQVDALPEASRIHKLASGANGGFYFHGTDQSTADTIARF